MEGSDGGAPSEKTQRLATRRRQVRARPVGLAVSLGGPALLILLGVVLYANSFSVPYLLDDQIEIVRNKEIVQLKPLWSYLTRSRGVLELSLAWNYQWGALQVWGYHLVNLLVHLINGLLVYALVLGTLRLPTFAGRYARHAHALALVTGLVFLAHPMQTNAATYIIQRAESIASLFYLLTILLFWYGATAPSGQRQAWAYAGAVVATLLGILTKQITATIPFTVVLYQVCFLSGGREQTKRRGRWIVYAFLFAAFVGTLAMSWQYLLPRSPARSGQLLPSIFIPTAGFGVEGVTPWHYLLTQFGVVTWYLRLYLWPDRLCFDYGWPLVDSAWRLDVVLPFLLLLAIGLAGILAFRRYRLATFCIGWFFIVLAPTSSLLPLRDAAFEHRMYLPIAGLSWLIVVGAYDAAGWLAQRTGIEPRTVWRSFAVGAAMWVVTLGVLTVARNHVLQDPLRLAADSADKAPSHWRPQYEYGRELMVRDRKDEAIAAFEEAIRRDSSKGPPRIYLAQIYMERGMLDEAEVHLRETAKVRERSMVAAAFRQLGFIYEARQEWDSAINSFTTASRLMPKWVAPHKELARLYARQGRWLIAAQQYDAVMRLNENVSREFRQEAARADYNGAGLLRYFGKTKEAARLLEKVAANRPAFMPAHLYLALDYANLGEWAMAEAAIATAVRLSPNDPIVRENAARIRNREARRTPPKPYRADW